MFYSFCFVLVLLLFYVFVLLLFFSTCQGCQEHQQLVVSGTNVVAMARHGPISKDNEATGSGKVFRYLPGLRDTIKKSKIAAKVPKCKNTVFYRRLSYIFLYYPILPYIILYGDGWTLDGTPAVPAIR